MEEDRRPIGVDLFCGAGGMSLGFEQAGFNVVAAVDSDDIHVQTHRKNFPHCRTITADLTLVTGDWLRSRTGLDGVCIDVLFGGTPCQGFSSGGRRRENDPRNELLWHFGRLALELEPRYFVIENVSGLLGKRAYSYLEQLLELVDQKYDVVTPIAVLDASDFGVPQVRRRAFIFGYLKGLPRPRYPQPSENRHKPTVWDAIGDLPNADEFDYLLESDVFRGHLPPPHSDYARQMRGGIECESGLIQQTRKNGKDLTGFGRTLHRLEVIRRFAETEPGTPEPISRFFRLKKDGLSRTLRAGSGSDFGSYTAPRPIHPVHPRVITVREAARLHSFPDRFIFHPTKWHGFRQIGNSVPPLLAQAVAASLLNSLNEIG